MRVVRIENMGGVPFTKVAPSQPVVIVKEPDPLGPVDQLEADLREIMENLSRAGALQLMADCDRCVQERMGANGGFDAFMASDERKRIDAVQRTASALLNSPAGSRTANGV